LNETGISVNPETIY